VAAAQSLGSQVLEDSQSRWRLTIAIRNKQLQKGPNCNYKKLNRDLNVKLHGLKYNYENVQGFFYKILRFQRFLGFMELFSLRKIRRICPQGCGSGPPASAHGSMDFIKRRSLAT
jgi:hypothetical protein